MAYMLQPFFLECILTFRLFLCLYVQVCKYFLEAVEKKQYGWFWACPNGGKDCHYRHALPPGYVLKSQMKALLVEETEKIPVEEEIENQVIGKSHTAIRIFDFHVHHKHLSFFFLFFVCPSCSCNGRTKRCWLGCTNGSEG